MDIASIAFGMAIGLVVGLHVTVRFLRNKASEAEGDMLAENPWECTNCGFTASKPQGVCPLCKAPGTLVP